jgi:hypothetical protein
MTESLNASLNAQLDLDGENARRGFLLVYLNSFNEWHEGHSIEPMKDAADLSAGERRIGYHNPVDGEYRLRTLRGLLEPLVRTSQGQLSA